MNEKAKMLLDGLSSITPINIHQETDAGWAIRESFHSVWYRHSPQAARYMLLPYLYDDRVELTR